jgi:hypothetical protein
MAVVKELAAFVRVKDAGADVNQVPAGEPLVAPAICRRRIDEAVEVVPARARYALLPDASTTPAVTAQLHDGPAVTVTKAGEATASVLMRKRYSVFEVPHVTPDTKYA